MKKITIAIAIFTVMAMVSGSAFAATTLTVGETGKTYAAAPGATVDVPIVASSLAGIAGFAFTLTHGSLEVTGVTSTAISTFSLLGYDSTDGLGTDGKVDTFASPLVYNNVTAGEIKIAAAVPAALTGTASATLCTVTFKVPATALETDTFPVKIIPTNLKNEAAGYAATGEDIVAIIDATYSPLLSADRLKTAAPAGTLIVDTGLKGDANGDGKITTADALLVVQVALKKAGKTEADLQGECDVNVAGGDARITTADALTIVRYALKKITTWP
jgi:hypothetical protein